MGLGLGLGLAERPRILGGGASAPPLAVDGRTLGLDFTAGVYQASTVGGTLANYTLAQLVSGAVTPTASGMLISDTDGADDVTVPLSPAALGGSWFNQSTGTIYVEASIAYTNDSFPRVFEMSDGTDSNRLAIRLNQTSSVTGFSTIGGADYDLNGTYATTIKACIGWEPGALVFVVNGGSILSGPVTVPTLTGCQLGNRNTTKNRPLNGQLKVFRCYPTRFSGAQMQAATA